MSQEIINKLKEMGLNLFPLQPNSKKPIAGVNWKQYQDEKYNGVFPSSCNIAVVMGNTSVNTFVVDIDDESLYKEFDFDTFTVKTGRGYHIYFSYHGFPPPTMRVDDNRGRHIDVQSKGTYCLAPSSIHPDTGNTYDIIKDVPIMDISVSTLKTTLEKMGFKTEQKPIEDIAQGISEGGRNAGTFKYACHLIRQGVFGEALGLEIDKLNQKHTPPLPQSEIELIINQASKAESKSVVKHITDAKSVLDQLRGEKTKQIKMQQITPEMENKPVEFDCMITGVGERQTYTVEATFECPICHKSKDVKADDLHQMIAPYCMANKCIYNIDETTKQTAYIQQVRIQEFLEEARNASPIEFDAEIIDANVGEAFIGDRKTITAKFRSISMPHGKYNQIVFQILEMRDLDQKEGCMPSPEEVIKWKNTPNFFERVTASILPKIMVNPKHIETLILWACGGNTLNNERDNIHVGLLGDAQTAKSKMLLKMHQLLPGSGLANGRNTSGAGLTIGMVKLYNGTMIPKGGFFPQHTNHPCMIDEVDKMTKEGHDSCLEVMEQGTTTLTKNGVPSLTLPTNCPLLIAGNPKNGKFNSKYVSIMDNFDMEVPFVSRFDILWMMTDANDPETDNQIRKFIRGYMNRKDDYMTDEELQRYFVYIKSLDATISEEMMDKVDILHTKMRPLNVGGSLPIGWRQYHGLYRLLTASAKAHLRTTVIQEDFVLIEEIINQSYKTMRLDLETGVVSDPYIKEGDRKKLVINETWSECMDKDLDNTVDKEEFLKLLARKEGFNGLNVTLLFENMIKSGEIELNDEIERYKKVR